MIPEIRVGMILAWKGGGLYFTVLSFILGLVDKSWRERKFKPWHLSIVVKKLKNDDWLICEATWPRVRTLPLSVLTQIYLRDCLIIDWFGKSVSQRKVTKFVQTNIGAKYDILVYAFTILQHVLFKVFHIQVGRYNDGAFMCWEVTEEFCCFLGKPWENTHSLAHKYPLISEFMNEVEKIGSN